MSEDAINEVGSLILSPTKGHLANSWY